MAAVETTALLYDVHASQREECGRLDRGHLGVLARVRSGRRSNGFIVSAAQTASRPVSLSPAASSPSRYG